MAESSYDKVCKLLEQTPECRDLASKVAGRIASLKVSAMTFSLIAPEKIGQPARAQPRFTVSSEGGAVSMTTNGDSIWLDIHSFMDRREVNDVVEKNFGVKRPTCLAPPRVPTYFCRKSVLLGDDSRPGTPSFSRWLGERLESRFGAELQQAKERILLQCTELKTAQSTIDAGNAFLAERAVDQIKAALAAYKHLGDGLLKQAIQSFLVDDVFEYADQHETLEDELIAP